MIIIELAICAKSGFKIIIDNFNNLTVVPPWAVHTLWYNLSILTSVECPGDVKPEHQNWTHVTPNYECLTASTDRQKLTLGNDIYLTKLLSSIGRHQDIKIQCHKLTYPGSSLWRPQNLHGMWGSNVSDRRPRDIHCTPWIDVSYWPKLDQSPDAHRTSLGCQNSMSNSDLPGPSFRCPLDISMTSDLDVSIWHILNNGSDVTRPVVAYMFWPDQNRTSPDVEECQVFPGWYITVALVWRERLWELF